MTDIRSKDSSMIEDRRSNKRAYDESQTSRAGSIIANGYHKLSPQTQYQAQAWRKMSKYSRAGSITATDETKNQKNYQKMAAAKLKGIKK